MWEPPRGATEWSRRLFLLAIPAAAVPALADKGARFSTDTTEYVDRATEFNVTRCTDPARSSRLPSAHGRFISRRNSFLLYSSDREGSPQACSLDLGSGESRVLTEAAELVAESLQLLPGDRDCVYFDGQRLESCRLGSLRATTLYEIPDDWRLGCGLSASADGDFLGFIEKKGDHSRLRLLEVRRKRARTAIGEDVELSSPQLRPGKQEVLFRKEGALWIAGYNGRRARPLATAPGTTGPAVWTRDGASIVYLNLPQEPGRLNALREHFPDSRQDRLIANTTQYVAFGANANASVFVAVSGAKATPYILLMLRKTGRELALCEHGSSRPETATPVFSPDSRRIFFESDRDGKPAIYSMDVRGLVEATAEN